MLVVVGRRLAKWVGAEGLDEAVEALFAFFRRADVPDSVKHSVLWTMANAWRTSRRFRAEARQCVLGCGAAEADELEHYLFCGELRATALRHLRLDLAAVRHGGVGKLLGLLVSPGDRGMRLALHLDTEPMAYSRARHDMGGTGVQAYAARLNEEARRFGAVARTLRWCAAARGDAVPAG